MTASKIFAVLLLTTVVALAQPRGNIEIRRGGGSGGTFGTTNSPSPGMILHNDGTTNYWAYGTNGAVGITNIFFNATQFSPLGGITSIIASARFTNVNLIGMTNRGNTILGTNDGGFVQFGDGVHDVNLTNHMATFQKGSMVMDRLFAFLSLEQAVELRFKQNAVIKMGADDGSVGTNILHMGTNAFLQAKSGSNYYFGNSVYATTGEQVVRILDLINFSATNMAAGLVYVATNGNDSTGQRNNLFRPYLTPKAARNASVSNDTVVVHPGYYTGTGVQGLFKDKLNWYFLPGTILSNSIGVVAISNMMWNNTGFGGVAAAVESSILGDGVFIQQGGSPADEFIGGVFAISNTASKINIECAEIKCSTVSQVQFCVAVHEAKEFTLKCRLVDGAYGTNELCQPSEAGAIWWKNGHGNVDVDSVFANYTTLYGLGDTPSDWFLNIKHLISTNSAAIWFGPSIFENRVWLTVDEMVGASNAATTGGAVIDIDGGKAYITAKKISKRVGNSDTVRSPVVGVDGGQLWLNSQKVTTTNEAAFFEQNSGHADITVQDWEDVGAGGNTRAYNFLTAGGTNIFHGGDAFTKWGPGMKVSGGLSRVKDFVMNTQGAFQLTNHTFWITGGELTLQNCTGIPGGTNVVFASSAQDLRIYGTLHSPSNISPNVTIIAGDLLVNTNINR